MFHTLYIANNTYYIIHKQPKTVTEWIVTAYGTRIVVIKTKSKTQATKVLQIIALIHHIESLQKIEQVPYISNINQSK
jgi:hypothetical protein